MQFTEIRDGLSDFFRKHDYWLLPLLRSLTAFLVLLLSVLNFTRGITGGVFLLLIFMTILASFLPWSVIPMEAGVLLLYCLYRSSLELALSAAVFFLLLTLVQSAFRGGYAVLIALMPLAFLFHIPYVLPMIAGLSLGLVAAVPIALGTMLYYFLRLIAAKLGAEAGGSGVEELASRYGELFLEYIGNRELVLLLFTLLLCFLAVFVIRSIPFDYSWYAAVLAGALLSLAAVFLGSGFLAGHSLLSELGAVATSLGTAVLYILFVHDADYRRTEKLQFEDDSYFYYVKAVPKRRSR